MLKTDVKTVRFFSVGYTNRISVENLAHLAWHSTKSELTESVVSDLGANEAGVKISEDERNL